MNSFNSYLINSKTVNVNESEMIPFRWYNNTMEWEEPDEQDLMSKMRLVFEQRDEAKAVGVKARQSLGKFTWERPARKMLDSFRNAYKRHNEEIFMNRKQRRAEANKQYRGKRQRARK